MATVNPGSSLTVLAVIAAGAKVSLEETTFSATVSESRGCVAVSVVGLSAAASGGVSAFSGFISAVRAAFSEGSVTCAVSGAASVCDASSAWIGSVVAHAAKSKQTPIRAKF